MTKDAVFRIASMTKPVTGVAIMMMMEEGRLRITDPVSKYIPAFKDLKVAIAQPRQGPPAGADEPARLNYYSVPAEREVTIRDLLTHVSGLASGAMSNDSIRRGELTRKPTDTLADYIPRLGKSSLEFQPGSRWTYSPQAGFDTLGRIVEITSGQPFDQFLRQRLFEPLGIKEAAFYPTPELEPRMVTAYQLDPKGKAAKNPNSGGMQSKVYFMGSGGLITTAEEYAKFAQMLVNGGALNGKRYLSPKTVELMTSNATGDMVNGQFGRPAKGMGFALGVQIWLDPVAADRRVSAGAFGWEGAYGTHQVMDPAEKMVEIIMMQGANGPLQRDFENAVRQAMID